MAKLRVAGINEASVVDGPGIRYVVFVQGCTHHCKGCHNPETWDPDGGVEMDVYDLSQMIITSIKQNKLSGLTISGGEPMQQALPVLSLIGSVRAELPETKVIVYTGYPFEKLIRTWPEGAVYQLIGSVDWLIDSPYIEEYKTLEQPWRGSMNQRIIVPWMSDRFLHPDDLDATIAVPKDLTTMDDDAIITLPSRR